MSAGTLLHLVLPVFPFQAHLLGEVPDGADDGEKRGRVAAADLVPELTGDGRRGRQDVSQQWQQQQQGLLCQEQEGPTPPPQKESGRLVRAQAFVILGTQERGVCQFMHKYVILVDVAEPSALQVLSGLGVSLGEIPPQPLVFVCLDQYWQSELLKAVTAGGRCVCEITCSFSLLDCWVPACASLWAVVNSQDLEWIAGRNSDNRPLFLQGHWGTLKRHHFCLK